LIEIRKSAFITLWKQSPLQKSVVHDLMHAVCPIYTVKPRAKRR
jgi:hypothetical protein